MLLAFEAFGDPEGGADDGAAADAGEDAFLLREVAGEGEAGLAVDDDLPVEDGLVKDLRDEALFEGAQALDVVAGVGSGGDDADVGVARLEAAAGAGERSPVPRPATKAVVSGRSRRISTAVPCSWAAGLASFPYW